MCGRYSLPVTPEELEEIFDAPVSGVLHLPRWNVAPTQDAPVVVTGRKGRRIEALRWGLVPYWADHSAIGARYINARAESVATSRVFGEALVRRRCLVPADGFYEWTDRPGGGSRLPHWIHHRRGGLLAFAGLRERWRRRSSGATERLDSTVAEELLQTFTIITRAPNSTVAPLHDRMPVVLPPSSWDAWLDAGTSVPKAVALLQPAPDDLLEARAVSPRVNRVENDDRGCIEPYVEPYVEPGLEPGLERGVEHRNTHGSELLDLFEDG